MVNLQKKQNKQCQQEDNMKKEESLKELGEILEYEQYEINGSSIQQRTYKLFTVKLSKYTLDDIRFMIGQEVGLSYTIPIAIEELEKDLIIETSYYKGDLLKIILLVNSEYWLNNQILKNKITNLILTKYDELNCLDNETKDEIIRQFTLFNS